MPKKGIIEIQFHWIFVLIVGAVILLFFATMIYNQRAVSEQGISADVLSNLESIVSNSMISTKTLNILDVPKGTEIRYKNCNTYEAGAFSKPTKTIAMFAPERIAGRNLITWALDWNVPYTVTNFLYLTSNEVRYILVDDDKDNFGFINEIDKEIMPDAITRDIVYYDNGNFKYMNNDVIKAKGNYKVRFVFYNNNPSLSAVTIPNAFKNLRALDLTAVNIIPNTDDRVGAVEFYKYDNRNDKFILYNQLILNLPYLKKEAIIGAIFSENPETYKCAMEKAFTRLNYVTQVYLDRTEDLYDYHICYGCIILADGTCECPRRQLGQVPFRSKASVRACFNNYVTGPLEEILIKSASFEEQNVISIFNCAYISCDTESSLEELNRKLQVASCSQIY